MVMHTKPDQVVDAVEYQVFVDESAPCSLQLLKTIEDKALECNRVDDGVYAVIGYPESIKPVLVQYEDCILKAEPVN